MKDEIESKEEDLKAIRQAMRHDTDISLGIQELFKDDKPKKDDALDHHSVDIRTRLVQKEVSAMSLANFLTEIKFEGLRPSMELKKLKFNSLDESSLGCNLNILMFNLKRHKISQKGKSREEIIKILQQSIETRKQMIQGSIMGRTQ